MGAFLQNLLPVPPPPHTMEMQCLGAGQLQVSMHKGTATTSTAGKVKINLLPVSCRQSANLQGFSQRDLMGVMMFNGNQSTLTANGRLLRARQPSLGIKTVVRVSGAQQALE